MEDFAVAYAIGTAVSHAQLVDALAAGGIVNEAEVELFRHSALQGFDELRERRSGMDAATIDRLEKARLSLEQLWSNATKSAEDRALRDTAD